ncbi:unnamed protein product [Microthlaspi erraticum]|uniref:non-specific serine/threonine protein kinase n=1 Tax=Microthlaspi erraticum TaxID=1685480 RepID=A0A6D2K2B9_9BRAS|nr:unnamed protein product [Microthlaspi erraticum]CAA7046392.1 unnamed protein product [Microthlaspi erraticum]
MAQGLHLIWMIFCVHLTCISSQQEEPNFIFNGFHQADLYTDGLAKILPKGQLQLTDGSGQRMGHAFIKKPLVFTSPESLSFSTHFVCALVPGANGGHGIAFVLSASMDLTQADATQYLGIFNISTQGSNSSHIVAVELDTALSSEFDDINNNHVGIDVNSLISVASTPASYFSEIEGINKDIKLLSGDPIQVWVDYGGSLLNVSLAPLKIKKPSQPLLSQSINISEIFPGRKIFLGFSGATGTLVSYQYILGWSFSRRKVSLQSLDVTKLPKVPSHGAKKKRPSTLLIVLLILLAIIGLLALGGAYVYRRRMYAEVREEWEKEYGPHRFSYKALYNATKGFHKDGLLGKGGFGNVYKGKALSSSNGEIAVKRVSHDAEEGMKQFVAEIVSMGNLKHKNMVPLLGYCRRKGELLLVSEYMPNGSLDRYLFHQDKPPFSWRRRLVIIKDIASALNYMHTGAPQVVLHRDIKASNVMLDAEFNGRLGDFGMARFHDHGADPATTSAVGTIGYMAPELSTMGASTETDVYGFGAFLLEVTCGRRPVEPGLEGERRFLVQWVCQCWRMASLLGARDARLRGEFSAEEVEMVLKLGLICTNAVAEMRPSMEEVVQYLNESLKLPDISPNSTGIGSFSLLGSNPFPASPITKNLSASFYTSSSANDTTFVTHSIVHGHGR